MDVNEEARDRHLLRPRSAAAQAEGVRAPLGQLQGARRSDEARDRQSARRPRRACVCDFNSLGLSQPTISHHLQVLREAGLIEVAYKRKTWVFYRLVPEAVEALAFALGGAPGPEFVLATAEATVAG